MNKCSNLEVRPYQLMCIVCRIGDGMSDDLADARLAQILRTVRQQPDAPITLRCNVDSVYRYQNPGRKEDTPEGELFNDKRDLDVIQKLGLAPGATRPARELFDRLLKQVPSAAGVCGYDCVTGPDWKGCPRASSGSYEKGRALGLDAIIPPRGEDEKARAKAESVRAMRQSDGLCIRPHHLMCMACFWGDGRNVKPIAEDNLYEAIEIIRKNPDVPVRLVAGCCDICPPCSCYDPATRLCVGGNGRGLRDQKKDLDVLQRLGLRFGDTLPARELYARLFETIRSTREICAYDDGVVRGWEWSICGGPEGNKKYEEARRTGMGFLPAES